MATKTLGDVREVEPNTALLEEIHRTAGHIEALGAIVAAIPKEQLVEGVTKTVESDSSGDDDGGSYRTVTTETAPNIWLRLYREERKHLLDACRAASSCGVVMAALEEEKDAVTDIQRRAALRIAR